MIAQTFFIALLVVVGSTAIKQPGWLLPYAMPSVLLGMAFLGLACLPLGSKVIGKRQEALPFLKYMAVVSLGQAVWCLITGVNISAFFQSVEITPSWFLFPWGLFGLWALMITYICYQKGQYPLIGAVIAGCLPAEALARRREGLKKAIDYILSTSSLLCLSFSIAAAIILMSRVLFGHSLKAEGISIIILSCAYPVFFWSLKHRSCLRWIKKLSFSQMIWMISIIFIFILGFSAFLAQGNLTLPKQMTLLTASCMHYFSDASIPTRMTGLTWGWCVIWVPLMGSFIARFSQGRTLREIMIAILFLPTLLLLGSLFLPKIHFSPEILFIASLLVLGIVSWGLKGMKNNLFLYAGFMPLPNPPKTSRTDLQLAPKLLGMQKTLRLMVMAVLSVLLIYKIGGIWVLAAQVFMIAIFMVSVLYGAGSLFAVLTWIRAQVLCEQSEQIDLSFVKREHRESDERGI